MFSCENPVRSIDRDYEIPYPSDVFEELLTRRTEQVVPSRFPYCQVKDRLDHVVFHQVVDEITVVELKANSEETESGYEPSSVDIVRRGRY